MGRSRTRLRLHAAAALLCAAAVSGCAYLQMPRIDPTGERIFATPPIRSAPAWPPPAVVVEPAPGPFGAPPPMPAPVVLEDAVSVPGSMAVTLSPHVTVAPVGSEVVLLASVHGGDGYLRTNSRLEWSIAPGGVGHFVAVGQNGPIDLLLGDFNRPRKVDNTFAIGSTSRRALRIDRGTPNPEDDVCVVPGQGWVTLTSPIEGTSFVTVLAPEVPAWDARTRDAVVQWVDAQWCLPPPAIHPAGNSRTLTTAVTRQSDQSPCEGWRVRYEIADGPAAGFAPDGAQAVEAATDAAGRASVEIFQSQPSPGTNRINVQIIRPAELPGAGGRRLVVGSGTTMTTWTAAGLALRKTGPSVATLGSTITYRIEVSNPGDLPAQDVVVTDDVPDGLAYLNGNPPAEAAGRRLQWRIGQLGPSESRSIELNFRAVGQGSVTNCAEAVAAGNLKASGAATTAIGVPRIDVRLTGPTAAKVGDEVSFDILVTNASDVAAAGLTIKDAFEAGLEHAAAESPIERELDELGPGQSQRINVTFRVTRPGRLCHTATVRGAEGVLASAQACLTADGIAAEGPQLEPGGRAAVAIKKTGPAARAVGELAEFTIELTNAGDRPLAQLKVVDRYDASLAPAMATEGYQLVGNDLVWTIDALAPGKTTKLEVHCRCLSAAAKACNRVSVASQEGAKAEGEACLEIRAAAPPEPAPAAALSMTLEDLFDPIAAGKELTYDLRVANDGQAADGQVAVTVVVPDGMTPVALGTSGPGKPAIEGQVIRFAPVAEIRPGQTLTYRIRILAKQPGRFRLRAELTSQNQPSPTVVEEETEVFQ